MARPGCATACSFSSYIEEQQRRIEQTAGSEQQQTFRDQAVAVLADPAVQGAFDVEQADASTLDRYGKNKFGLSLLMAYRLVEAGVSLVQVNLGKNSTWDTHRRNFVNLKRTCSLTSTGRSRRCWTICPTAACWTTRW